MLRRWQEMISDISRGESTDDEEKGLDRGKEPIQTSTEPPYHTLQTKDQHTPASSRKNTETNTAIEDHTRHPPPNAPSDSILRLSPQQESANRNPGITTPGAAQTARPRMGEVGLAAGAGVPCGFVDGGGRVDDGGETGIGGFGTVDNRYPRRDGATTYLQVIRRRQMLVVELEE